jgi:hypothetical protein
MELKMNSYKNKILSIVLFAFVIAANITAQPRAVISLMAYDYGNIIQDSVVTKIFVITNEGSEVLKINDVKASCGCTAVVAGKNELKPGESTEIKVSFDSKGKSGKQNKTITVSTNDPGNSIIKLAFTGNVTPKSVVFKNKNNKQLIEKGNVK